MRYWLLCFSHYEFRVGHVSYFSSAMIPATKRFRHPTGWLSYEIETKTGNSVKQHTFVWLLIIMCLFVVPSLLQFLDDQTHWVCSFLISSTIFGELLGQEANIAYLLLSSVNTCQNCISESGYENIPEPPYMMFYSRLRYSNIWRNHKARIR